jgi:hypothetical protein
MRARLLSLLLTAGALLSIACGREAPAPKPVNEAEARAFGSAYRRAVLMPDVSGATAKKLAIPDAASLFDWNAVIERASDGTGPITGLLLRAALRKLSAQGVVASTARNLSGGDISLLHVRKTENGMLVVMRLINMSGGVDYQEIPLQRGPDGVVRAVDLLTYSSGAYWSEASREFFLANTKTILPNLLNGRTTPLVEHMAEYREFYAQLRDGHYQKAEEIYHKLPAELREQRRLMLAHITVLQHLGGEEYIRACDEYRVKFPNSHGADLPAVHAFTVGKRYDEALRAIDRVDTTVGGDPYEDSYRAGVLLVRGDLDGARVAAARAMQREPTLTQPYFQQIGIALMRRDFVEVLTLLTALRDHANTTVMDLDKQPAYAEFVKSREYGTWIASLQVPHPSPATDSP